MSTSTSPNHGDGGSARRRRPVWRPLAQLVTAGLLVGGGLLGLAACAESDGTRDSPANVGQDARPQVPASQNPDPDTTNSTPTSPTPTATDVVEAFMQARLAGSQPPDDATTRGGRGADAYLTDTALTAFGSFLYDVAEFAVVGSEEADANSREVVVAVTGLDGTARIETLFVGVGQPVGASPGVSTVVIRGVEIN